MADLQSSAVPLAASSRKPTLYTIDYTSEKSQGGSSFCDLPDELLLEIGKCCFDGFGLAFWSHKPGKPRASSTTIRAAESFDTNGLKVLRLCKVVRRKLLPLLATMTNSRLEVYGFTHKYGHSDHGQV